MTFTHIRKNFAAAFFPRLSEWTGAFGVFSIGWVLSANPDLMASTQTRAYDLMLMIASQSRWSEVLMFFGGVRLLILLINGALKRSPHLRAITAFLSCFPICLIVLSFVQTFGIAMALSAVFLGMEMINVLRAAGDARVADYLIASQGNAGGSK